MANYDVYEGQTSTGITLTNNHTMDVFSGGVANSTTVNGGDLHIYRGGSANSITVNKGGDLFVNSGGTAINIIENGGYVCDDYGADVTYIPNTINGLVLNWNDRASLHSGTVANSVTVNKGGELFVESGGTAINIIENGGFVYDFDGADVTFLPNTINDLVLFIHQSASIHSGTVANNVTVNKGGSLSVYSGGIVTNIVENGGYVYVEEGADVTFLPTTINSLVVSNTRATLHSKTVANSTTVGYGGTLGVKNGGMADSTTVNGGSLEISNGGVVNSTTVYGGWMTVSSGGVANSTTVYGGWLDVSQGGIVNSVAVLRGNLNVYGILTGSLQIESGAKVFVREGGIVDFNISDRTTEDHYLINNLSAITGTPTYTITVSDSQETGTYKLAQNVSSLSESISIGTASETFGTITVNGRTQVYNDVEYTLIENNGDLLLNVLSPPSVFVYEEGEIVSSGTKITGAVISCCSMYIFRGGLSSDSVINSGGEIKIFSGGTAKLTNIYNGGGLHVFSGAVASQTTVHQGGYFGIGDGAKTYDTTIELFGALTVWNGGVVTGNTINSKGSLILSSGAVADQSVINADGGLHVFSGAVASNTTVNQGGFFGVGLGATTYNTTIGYAGSLTVWGGGVVHVNEINQWGAIILSSGAVANSTTINPDGGLHIFKGAQAYTTQITSGARLGIGGGGYLYSADLENTATMTFYDGSFLRGWVDAEGTIITSGTVNATGTYINFELGERSADQNVILDNIGKLSGVKRYSVEVETDQAAGTYQLAGGANGFAGGLALYVGDGNDCGTLAVGSCLDYGGKQYCLEQTNGILALRIA